MINIREISAEISIGLLDLMAFSQHQNLTVKREQEKAGTQFLLQKLLKKNDFKLFYSSENKPFLENEKCHLSISHSHDKLVIIINRTESTGIDIELIRDKVLKIRHKFLNDHEAAYAADNVEKLISIWAAKESLYKWYGFKNLDFKSHLSVENFDADLIFGKIETTGIKKKFRLVKEKMEDYVMVYILNEIAE